MEQAGTEPPMRVEERADRPYGGQQRDSLLLVGNIPSTWADATLKSLFASCGAVEECAVRPEGVREALVVQFTDFPPPPQQQWGPPAELVVPQPLNSLTQQLQQLSVDSATRAAAHPSSPSPVATPAAPSPSCPPMLSSSMGSMGYLDGSIGGSIPMRGPQMHHGYRQQPLPDHWRKPQQQQQPPSQQQTPGPQGWSSIFIKNMPEDADKLWLYEKFAKFGAVHNVRILVDEDTGKCTGVGYVNYCDGGAAIRAADGMNGVRMGDRLLHVMVQNHPPQARRQQQHGAAPARRTTSWPGGGGRGDSQQPRMHPGGGMQAQYYMQQQGWPGGPGMPPL